MSENVADSSALIVFLRREPGAETVARAIRDGSAVSAVNLAEAASKLNDLGSPDVEIRRMLQSIPLEIVDFDETQAFLAGSLRPITRRFGLSLGDRACLALARVRGLPVYTADQAWQHLQIGVDVRLIR